MNFWAILRNRPLEVGLIAWAIAQTLKLPLYYLQHRKWSWAPLLSAGGMPSSHSALMVGTTMGTGLYLGFDSAAFALAVAMTMIVIYDAAGVRREAGRHAEAINILFEELLSGHPVSDKQLREVLGHTPLEVAGGIVLGIIVGVAFWRLNG
ncbi:MAG: divergent PAP2 family protein [Anaerolineales bacterium]